MNTDQTQLLHHIANYAATGRIHDDLIPYYDQNGTWRGRSILRDHMSAMPHLLAIQTSHLPAPRRTGRDRHGTRLKTSFLWSGNEKVSMTYSAIDGSLHVKGNARIHASCLRHVGGSLHASTKHPVYLPCLETVGMDFSVMNSFSVKIPRLRHVGGWARLLGHVPPRLATVGGSLCVHWCFHPDSDSLKHVGGNLRLPKAVSVRLPALQHIGGAFALTLVVQTIDVPGLQSIGGDFLVPSAVSIRSRSLKSIGGHVDTTSVPGYYDGRIRVAGAWTTYPGDIALWERNQAARVALKQAPIIHI
jgi:hypothetical protein